MVRNDVIRWAVVSPFVKVSRKDLEGGLEPLLFPGLRCGLTQELLRMVYVPSITSSDTIFGLRIAVCKHLAWPSLI